MLDTATTTVKGMDIVGFCVSDPARAIAFYKHVLGLEPTEIDEQARGAEFTLADGSTFGVWKMDEGVIGGFMMFAVADARATVERLRAGGLEVSDVMETPVCLMSQGKDPDGNMFIIHQRTKLD